ncbi:isoprenoid synthase domain-containing protein [Mycena maculata]|uniref:Terpene synthase n=1 Tax=Mycena maculata TaxID=230809 RepID=A0AAD7J2Y2_9AGAR|nr:isoprenoid synthase domain-containing protein [Mycena maculata]
MPSPLDQITFRLPKLDDTFAVFPDNGLNPDFSKIRVESREWINQYNDIVCGPKMRALMGNCNFELVNSYFYPYADGARLRATMYLTSILWLYDEFTDTVAGAEATYVEILVARALREPDFHDDTWISRMMKSGDFREKNEVLDISSYVAFRRETSAVRTCFDLVEYFAGLDLPQHVHEDPVYISGYNSAIDLVFWTNDLFSYNMEQAKGHGGANVVTVIMKSKGVDLQTAIDFLSGYCEALTSQLQESRRILAARDDPVYSKDAVRIIDAFGDWVRGNDQWSFATERYFGQENHIIKKTRIVKLKAPFSDSLALNE